MPQPHPQIDKVSPLRTTRPPLNRLIQQCLMTVVEKFWPKIDSNGIANNRIELFIRMNSFAHWWGLCQKVVKFYSYLGLAAQSKTFLSDKTLFGQLLCGLLIKFHLFFFVSSSLLAINQFGPRTPAELLLGGEPAMGHKLCSRLHS